MIPVNCFSSFDNNLSKQSLVLVFQENRVDQAGCFNRVDLEDQVDPEDVVKSPVDFFQIQNQTCHQ